MEYSWRFGRTHWQQFTEEMEREGKKEEEETYLVSRRIPP